MKRGGGFSRPSPDPFPSGVCLAPTLHWHLPAVNIWGAAKPLQDSITLSHALKGRAAFAGFPAMLVPDSLDLPHQSNEWVTGRLNELASAGGGPAVPKPPLECMWGGSAAPAHLSLAFSQRGFAPCKPRKNKQCVKLSALPGNRHFLLPPLFSLNFAGVQAPFPATPSLSLGWIRRSLFSKVLEPKHQGVTQALQGPCSAGGSRPCPPFAWEVEGEEVREGSLKNLQK